MSELGGMKKGKEGRLIFERGHFYVGKSGLAVMMREREEERRY